MKCPKCGYLGFEDVERCRNCGYDFSLTQSSALPDLPIRTEALDFGPLDDLSLVDPTTSVEPARPPAPPSSDLPLFGPRLPDDEPLITKPSPPRPPLAVRRATPEIGRVRAAAPRIQTLSLALDGSVGAPSDSSPMARGRRPLPEALDPHRLETAQDAEVAARFVAVAIDLLILAAIDAIVIYFTMQICGVGLGELGLLPKWPLCAFLFVQNGGYLVAFTAGGQTLGKMAIGIKVVPNGSLSSVDLARAFVRELVWLALAVPAGLGFLTVFSRGHRGLHDRFAGTRVVR